MRIDDIVAGREVVICAGGGGVGKTTCAAALAAGMAQRGRRVLVVTIDPARRLAEALGLPEAGGDEHPVELETANGGQLAALMLDARETFDRLIAEQAPSPEARRRILANPIYQQLAGAVAGSHEYMAMEKLYELDRAGGYDLLVLDTPPSRHALDFLDAPERLTRFVEGRALRLLLGGGLRAGVLGLRALSPAARGSQLALGLLERLTGMTLLRDLSEFLAGFEGMYEGFRDRARAVSDLLASERTTFLVVTVPEEEPVVEAERFWRALAERDLPFGGAIVNKVHPDLLSGGRLSRERLRAEAEAALLDEDVAAETAARAAENLIHYQALAERDRRNIERLEARLGAEPVLEVPYLDHDVHDLPGLLELADLLFRTRAGERALH
jgi:anion-transporting  ArsA/GET3 family ATPase